MINENQKHEYALALAWFEGKYNQEEVQWLAEWQGIDFNRVKNEYGNIYAECEAIEHGY